MLMERSPLEYTTPFKPSLEEIDFFCEMCQDKYPIFFEDSLAKVSFPRKYGLRKIRFKGKPRIMEVH